MKQKILLWSNILFFLILMIISFTKADLPVHCLVTDIEGEWTLRINKLQFVPKNEDDNASCGHGLPNKVETGSEREFSWANYEDIKLKLDRYYKVYEGGNLVGNWTPVYDQSFVIFYKNSVITAPYKYYQNNLGTYVSECSKSMVGWYIPDKDQVKKNWSCFFAFKTSRNFLGSNSFLQVKTKIEPNKNPSMAISLAQFTLSNKIQKNLMYEHLGRHVVNEINKADLTWKAEVHDEFKGLSLIELKEKLGLRKGTYEKAFNSYNYVNEASLTKEFYDDTKSSKASRTNLLQINKVDKDLEAFFKKLEADTGMYEEETSSESKGKNKIKISSSTDLKTTPTPTTVESSGSDETIPNDRDANRDKDSAQVTDFKEISKYINTPLEKISEDALPRNWDWRNVGGKNYIPKIKRQGNCGSCYVFSAVTSLEARLRIQTDNQDTTEFSKQYPISCNFYSEGCDGGYPFLVGKFFNEFEIVPEECFPYTQSNSKCQNVCDYQNKYSKKYRVKEYGYLGGYYGATSEILMIKELRARGPIPGNIKVPYTFNYYKKGIFAQSQISKNNDKLSKTTMVDRNLSWEKVEHSITLVGYGEENGLKYWIGMNTWGPDWGENGFFRILRGENECGIESMGDVLQLEVSYR